MHIAILTGGISTEREVALRSGENMNDWVSKAGYTSEIFDFPSDIHRFLKRYQTSILAKNFPTKNLKKHVDMNQDFDLVIPVFHGIYGEDGQVTAFLRTLNCKYAFSDFQVHTLCIDKYQTNLFLEKFGIKIPETEIIRKNQGVGKNTSTIPFPIIIKPNTGGSSIGIYKVKNETEFNESIRLITDDDILIQSCIEGREFTVGVYRDSYGYHTLPIMEIVTHDNVLFDFHEKYETDGYNEIFLEGENDLQKILQAQSTKITELLHCRGVIRIDYRYDGENLYFLEVNTIPGFRTGSFVPKMWKKTGKSEKEFIDMLMC